MKTKEEIEQLAEKEFDNIDKPTRSGKDKHSYLLGFLEAYSQCQEDVVKDVKSILNNSLYVDFISKKEILKYINSLNKQD